jgi:hypothetical protein
MSIEITTATAPAHWACYLLYGDASGFDYYDTPADNAGERDKADCDRWVDRLSAEGWRITCPDGEPYFAWYNDAYGSRRCGCEVLEYTLIREARTNG